MVECWITGNKIQLSTILYFGIPHYRIKGIMNNKLLCIIWKIVIEKAEGSKHRVYRKENTDSYPQSV